MDSLWQPQWWICNDVVDTKHNCVTHLSVPSTPGNDLVLWNELFRLGNLIARWWNTSLNKYYLKVVLLWPFFYYRKEEKFFSIVYDYFDDL